MREDIQTGYPNDYYQLKRRVTKEIIEQLETWVYRASTDKPATQEEIRTWVRQLSLRTGISEKGIIVLFAKINPKTQEWFA
jgi:hypothetical protein